MSQVDALLYSPEGYLVNHTWWTTCTKQVKAVIESWNSQKLLPVFRRRTGYLFSDFIKVAVIKLSCSYVRFCLLDK